MQVHHKILDKSRRYLAGLEIRSESVWPGLRNDLFVAHASIYSFAAGFVGGKAVLDAGCGTGYGSEMLLRAGAASVLGLDISEASVRFAHRHYESEGLEFLVADLQNVWFENRRFDIAVSSNVSRASDRAFCVSGVATRLAVTGG